MRMVKLCIVVPIWNLNKKRLIGMPKDSGSHSRARDLFLKKRQRKAIHTLEVMGWMGEKIRLGKAYFRIRTG